MFKSLVRNSLHQKLILILDKKVILNYLTSRFFLYQYLLQNHTVVSSHEKDLDPQSSESITNSLELKI